jgi:hypothetical protein
MAIKINAGTPPQLGRITMPKGTYLPSNSFDNPGGAVDGVLGGAAGNNVGMWGGYIPGSNILKGTVGLGGNAPSINPFTGNYNPQPTFGASPNPLGTAKPPKVTLPQDKLFYNDLGEPVEYEQHHIWDGQETVTYNPIVRDAQGNQYTWDPAKKDYVRDSTSAFANPTSPANGFVGQDLLSAPTQLTMQQIRSMMGGMTPDQINETMASRGYTRSYVSGVGEVFTQTSQPTTTKAKNPTVDSRGRPEFVDPTALQRGERVTDARGMTYVGGTPYTDKNGKTVSQYAVTLPGVKDDPHGKYKWTSRVVQDDSGNWVNVYSQELRKVWKNGGNGNGGDGKKKKVNTGNGNAPSTLVNLRADYG